MNSAEANTSLRRLGGFSLQRPVVGMLHAPPLPGSPRYGGSSPAVEAFVLRDAESLIAGGVHGLMLENYGDAPFFPGRVPSHVVASLTALAVAVRRRFDVPLGINVLRNDGRSALAVANAAGAAFIRVNVLCGARLTDQGLIEGIAHELLRDRTVLQATDIEIWADVDVKHSVPLAAQPLGEQVSDLLDRGGADAVIVSGAATGSGVNLAELDLVRQAAGPAPVLVGSGATLETLEQLLPRADGLIVGTAFKRDGLIGNPVDAPLVRAFMRQWS